MNSIWLLIALSTSIGSLLNLIWGGSVFVLLGLTIFLFLSNRKLALISAFSILGFLLSERPIVSSDEALGKILSMRDGKAVIGDIVIWEDGSWKRVAGRGYANVKGEGVRVYCKGMRFRIGYPEYTFEDCWAFPLDEGILGRVKGYLWKVRRDLEGYGSLSVDMAISKQNEKAKRAGLSHLFAFSGFHAGVLFSMIYFLIFPFFPSFFYSLPIAVILTYVLTFMSGPSPSAQRAIFMLSIWTASKLLDYPVSKLNILGMSMFSSLIADPYLILSPSFLLSHLATLGVMIALERKETRWMVPFYANLYTIPVVCVIFREISPLSPVLSFLLSPIAALQVFLGEMIVLFRVMGFEKLPVFLKNGIKPIDFMVERALDLAATLPKLTGSCIVVSVLASILIAISIKHTGSDFNA